MTTRVVATALLLFTGIGASEPLLACGEKFLMGSRGSRFQRPGPVRTAATILIYANPATNLASALANIPYDATLRKAGYRPTVVSSADAFDSALTRGGWDLVVADAAASGMVASRTANNKGPIVLPLMLNATAAELAAAKKQYPRVLKGPIKNQAFLEAIDDALVVRSSAGGKVGG